MFETNRKEVFFQTSPNNNRRMLPEAIVEAGNGFRKVTDKFRDESFYQ